MMRNAMVLSCFLVLLPACVWQSKKSSISPVVVPVAEVSGGSVGPYKIVHTNDLACSDRVTESCRGLPSGEIAAYDAWQVDVRVAELESKHNDIPVPLGAVPIGKYFMQQQMSDGVIFAYTSTSKIQKLYDFFMDECVRLGWRLCSSIVHVEALLCFKKPDCYCTISIRPSDSSGTVIVICVSSQNSCVFKR